MEKQFRKMGLVIGFIVALLLLINDVLPSKIGISAILSYFGVIMFAAVLSGGAIAGFIIENRIIVKLTKKGSAIGTIIGSILISPLAYQDGFAGGTFGGGWVRFIVEKLGAGESGINIGLYIGIFFGMILGIIILELMGAYIGAFLGSRIRNIALRLSHQQIN